MSRILTLLAAGDVGFVPSNYMPSMKVEIAFNAGYTTPDASRVWTDVSEWVELDRRIGTSFGRQDERSTADANSLTLTLDNSDGRFTAGRSLSPYYPNVKIGRPIRLSLMTVTGHTSVRFVGFIDEWPVEWNGTDAYAQATVRASSRLARLGLSTKLRSMIESQLLSARPAWYWTLGDAQGSSVALESSGSNQAALTIAGTGSPVVFGTATGPGGDGLTAAQFDDGEYLAGTINLSGSYSVHATVLLGAIPGPSAFADVVAGSASGIDAGSILIDDTGAVTALNVLGPNIDDGLTHDIVMTQSGATGSLYVDGALIGTSTNSIPPPAALRVGRGLVGVVSHVAIYESALSAAQVSDIWDVVSDGSEGDRTDQRAVRLLGWAGVASTEVSVQTGVETMTYQQTSGQSVVDALRDVESTESGVLFDGRDGRVTFHNRTYRYTAPVAVTLDMAAQQVEADYAPKLDRSTLINDVTVDNPTTGESARAIDTASDDEYGSATASTKSVAASYDPLQQKAAWLLASYAEPRSRVPSLSVDVLAQVGSTPSAEDILSLTVGSRIAVVNQPAQADAASADYFVEGYTESIGPESYRITFNLSPAHPSLSVFVLEDPVRGQLDSTYVLAL